MDLVSFWQQAGQLKATLRTGWTRYPWIVANDRVESVADHSWRMAMMCATVAACETIGSGQPLDAGRCAMMSVIHDVAECITTDLIVGDSGLTREAKRELEASALESLLSSLTDRHMSDHLRTLWSEYELRESPESRFVKQCDLLEMLLQADRYEAQSGDAAALDLEEFFVSTPRELFTFSKLLAAYDALLSRRRSRLGDSATPR